MDLIADGLFIATALTAALYCLVLSHRLRRLTDSQSGIPTQIQSLNKALEDTKAALDETRKGVADARGTAKRATESLAREVWIAKQTAAELDRACTEAESTLGKFTKRKPVKHALKGQEENALDETFAQTSGSAAAHKNTLTSANLVPDEVGDSTAGEIDPDDADGTEENGNSRTRPAKNPQPAGQEIPANIERQNDGMLRMQRMAI